MNLNLKILQNIMMLAFGVSSLMHASSSSSSSIAQGLVQEAAGQRASTGQPRAAAPSAENEAQQENEHNDRSEDELSLGDLTDNDIDDSNGLPAAHNSASAQSSSSIAQGLVRAAALSANNKAQQEDEHSDRSEDEVSFGDLADNDIDDLDGLPASRNPASAQSSSASMIAVAALLSNSSSSSSSSSGSGANRVAASRQAGVPALAAAEDSVRKKNAVGRNTKQVKEKTPPLKLDKAGLASYNEAAAEKKYKECKEQATKFYVIRQGIENGQGRKKANDCLCTICDHTGKSIPAMVEHIAHKHLLEPLFACLKCGGLHMSKRIKNFHAKTCRGSQSSTKKRKISSNLGSSEEEPVYVSDLNELKKFYTKTSSSRYNCGRCLKSSDSETKMKKHVRTKHLPDQQFKCLDCDSVWLTITDFNRHQQTRKHIKQAESKKMRDLMNAPSSSKKQKIDQEHAQGSSSSSSSASAAVQDALHAGDPSLLPRDFVPLGYAIQHAANSGVLLAQQNLDASLPDLALLLEAGLPYSNSSTFAQANAIAQSALPISADNETFRTLAPLPPA